MGKQRKFYLVSADALPGIFHGVVEARRALETGEAKTIGQAAKMAGISRSAFYKYKDSVLPFYDRAASRIITFEALLKHAPGVLSEILSVFATSGANILTINQSIPINGHAFVTVSADTVGMRVPVETMVQDAQSRSGVIRFDVVSGEA
jgi:chorismate mutase